MNIDPLNSRVIKDPDPALLGPPTQTISGVKNKAPLIDNPNVKLQTQEAKSLDPSGKFTGVKNKISGFVNKISDKLSNIKDPKGYTPDGLNKNWYPNKYSPSSIAGNTKYVDPKTGKIGSTSELVKSGNLNNNLKLTSPQLQKIQNGLPKPNIPTPTNIPRIKVVEMSNLTSM